jgi:hypothetical protein
MREKLKELESVNKCKEREAEVIRENNESMLLKLAHLEQQIAHDITAKNEAEEKLARERVDAANQAQVQFKLEQELKSAETNAEEETKKVEVEERHLKSLLRSEAELRNEVDLLGLEIKRAESQRVFLESTTADQIKCVKEKQAEREMAVMKLKLSEKQFEDSCVDVSKLESEIKYLHAELARLENTLGDKKSKVVQLQAVKRDVEQARLKADSECINQLRKVKQSDLHLANVNSKLQQQNDDFEAVFAFSQKLAFSLECVAHENNEIAKKVNNKEEIRRAVNSFAQVIDDARSYLISI